MDTTRVLMPLGGWLAPRVGLWLFGFWWVVVLWHLWLGFEPTFKRLFVLRLNAFLFSRLAVLTQQATP